ncbi:MAG: radical SAM protein [Dysgonamonadaceae bacterium]
MKRVVILHACPPVQTNIPLASLTILKSFLVKNGFDVKIVYWNLIFKDLQSNFSFQKVNIEGYSVYSELLFLNYLAISKKDFSLYEKVKTILMLLNMENINKNPEFIDKHMASFKKKTDEIIYNIINEYEFSNALCFGFSLKLDQWLFSSILGDILKTIFYDIPIIVGGINTKKSATSILENFKQFDIAAWGEGEHQLLQIVKNLQLGNFVDIPYIAYRKNNQVELSKSNKKEYADLSEPTLLDFSDFFNIIDSSTNLSRVNCQLPIEGSRGCHWGKCHFCYLNVGYKYRTKNLEKIRNEITSYIKQWGVYSFLFLDTDIIGINLDNFNKVLDCFIEIKRIEPRFKIVSAEIITQNLDRQTILKMSKAGIFSVQIGWESTSDSLLSKMEKKNTFASNLFFMKIATENNIRITGMNVLTNLFEETEKDIFEAIQNTKFLRFYRNNAETYQMPSRLTVNATSKYVIKDKNFNIEHYVPLKLMHKCVSDYVSKECAWEILDYWLPYKNEWWDIFDRQEIYYRRNKHSYKITLEEKQIKFHEYVNFKEVYSLDILLNSLDSYIFELTNDIITLEKLCDSLRQKYNLTTSPNNLIRILDYYFSRGLIYHNKDYSQIISIINYNISIK